MKIIIWSLIAFTTVTTYVHSTRPKTDIMVTFQGVRPTPELKNNPKGRVQGSKDRKTPHKTIVEEALDTIDHSAVYAEEAPEPHRAITLPEQEEIANKIRMVFTEEPEKAVAVFRAESGLRPDAQGWNCHYYRDNGDRYSAACEFSDRGRAWSVDCGIAQLNFPGLTCPAESLEADWNIQKAYEWKYKPSGWRPWVAEAKGRHLQFLE